MPESTLITYSCCHYTITPYVHDSTLEDLYNIATTRHRISRHQCTDCGDAEISLQEFRGRFESALRDIRDYFTGATIEYLQISLRYFGIPSKSRSSSPPSNLAHSQYGTEGRRWDVDPFFAPWLQALRIVAHAEAELRIDHLSATDADRIRRMIHEARAIIGSVVSSLQKLDESVEKIEERKRMQEFGRSIKQHARTRAIEREENQLGEVDREARRLQRRKRRREAFHDRLRRELPRMAFEHAVFAAWQKRIEGFERMEEIEP